MPKYNPFANVTDIAPEWINSGSCYATAFYVDRNVAKRVAAYVRERGDRANGGWMDGMALGTVEATSTGQFAVTYA